MQQKNRPYRNEKYDAGKITLASGLAMIAAVFVAQYLSLLPLLSAGTLTLSEGQMAAFQAAALPTLAVFLAATGVLLAGLYVMVNNSWGQATTGIISPSVLQRTMKAISQVLHTHKRMFWLTLSLYAVIFLFASNTIVYSGKPVSQRYGAAVPSAQVIGCCGSPGSFPVVTIYLFEHLGLLIIPVNIVLTPFLSLLVAVNTSIIWRKARASRTKGAKGNAGCNAISYFGISAGAFAGCPACASSILLLALGGTGLTLAGTLSATMAKFQPLFAISSIGALIIGLVILSRDPQTVRELN